MDDETEQYHHPFLFVECCYAFLASFFAAFLATFAGRLLPNEPLKRLPFAVFLSPLPIVNNYLMLFEI
ncbi:MAG: hypothetical protein QM725_11820 [Lacibacter sp.]